MSDIKITKSRVKTLDSCPLLYKWQYIDNRKPDAVPAAVTTIGLDVHEIFNKFYDNINVEEIPDNPLEYFKCSMIVLPQYKGIFDLFCLYQTKRWLKYKKYDRMNEFIPLLREQKIINNNEVGVIDCLFIDGNEYAIIDYKSSAGDPTNLRFELNYYKRLIDDAKILDKPVKYIGAYGYKDGSSFYEEVNTRSWNLMLKKIDEFKNTDFEKMNFYKKPGYHCDWCQYILSCNKEK